MNKQTLQQEYDQLRPIAESLLPGCDVTVSYPEWEVAIASDAAPPQEAQDRLKVELKASRRGSELIRTRFIVDNSRGREGLVTDLRRAAKAIAKALTQYVVIARVDLDQITVGPFDDRESALRWAAAHLPIDTPALNDIKSLESYPLKDGTWGVYALQSPN